MPNVATQDEILRHPEASLRRKTAFGKKENKFLKAYLTQPAHNGLGNKQLIEVLAERLNLKKYQIKIIRGDKSKDKVIEIDVPDGAVKK
jgi:uncharacterized protein YggU (UPF0235/DUF167 family)